METQAWSLLVKLATGVEVKALVGKLMLGVAVTLGLMARYLALIAMLLSVLPATPFRITAKGIERDTVMALFSSTRCSSARDFVVLVLSLARNPVGLMIFLFVYAAFRDHSGTHDRSCGINRRSWIAFPRMLPVELDVGNFAGENGTKRGPGVSRCLDWQRKCVNFLQESRK